MFPNSELAVKVHMESNGEDPNKWLFVVKQHSVLNRFQKTGIACAVKKTVNRKKREFLLTCKDTQNQRENIFAHCVCHRLWNALAKLFYRRHEPFDISNSREDDIFSFTPVKNCCNKGLPMVSEDKDAEKKFAAGVKVGCRSFINAGNHFRTVHWLYHKEKGEHYLQNADLPKHHHEALGSPVLWTDDHDRSFVVGVVGYSADQNLRPKFFTESALRITEVPMPVQLEDLLPKVKQNHITLKWSKPQDQKEPIEKYTVYQGTVNESGKVTELTVLTTIKDSSDCKYLAENLERGKEYEFLVTATNKYGEGLKGQGKQVKVLKDVPMAVKLYDIPSDGRSNDFTLKWKEPKNNGAVILDYMVYRRTVNESGEVSEWEFVKSVAAVTCALTECVITLERGKTFDVLVTARNKCGESLKQKDNAKRVEVSEDIFENVGFGFLVLFLLGSLAFWCLWASGFIGFATLFLILLGAVIVLHLWRTGDAASFQAVQGRARRLQTEMKKLLPRFVLTFSADIFARVQRLKYIFANVGFGFLVLFLLGNLAFWCLWASGFIGFATLFLILLGAVVVLHLWRTGDAASFQAVQGRARQLQTEMKKLLPRVVLTFSADIFTRVQRLKYKFDNFANAGCEFLIGFLGLCCLWATGFFVNVGFLVLLYFGILAVWYLWRTEYYTNVGFGSVLVWLVLGILAVWYLYQGHVGSRKIKL